jgi:hypothetical protein
MKRILTWYACAPEMLVKRLEKPIRHRFRLGLNGIVMVVNFTYYSTAAAFEIGI